jgi:predicted flap endonuclease-1-like 5' DNA nuclease
MAVLSSRSFTEDNPTSRANKGKLVKIEVSPGRLVKMYEADAVAAGHIKPKTKALPASENKMILPTENKTADDFSGIPGIGPAAARAILAHGIATYDDLKTADLSFLPKRAQESIEAWK